MMELIHLKGLNCYHDCVITMANFYGLDYAAAFLGLWAEGRLRYDPICQVFLSRSLQETLKSAGMKLNTPLVTRKEREWGWEGAAAGENIIIGMDAFLIPWSPLYQIHHGPHYFIARKEKSQSHGCFDPTYGLSGQRFNTQDLLSSAFALITVKTVNAAIPLSDSKDSLATQAQKVQKNHPETLRRFRELSGIWMQKSQKTALLSAKYVDALLNGRYLFMYYLKERSHEAERAPLFFSPEYNHEWLAVKNGFYKAALTRENGAVCHESCQRLACLFEQELELARQLCPI